MRQAGRYMAEYRALRERYSLLEICAEPELATTVTLQPVRRIEVDARVGGRFSFVQRRGAQDVDHVGEYLVIDRPKRLVFTWGVAPDPAESTVTIEIAPRGTGCELVLVHEMDPKWAEYVARTEHGWRTMMETMAPLLD